MLQHQSRLGGHDVAESVIRWRWAAGLCRFFGPQPFPVDSWSFFDNRYTMVKVAHGDHSGLRVMHDKFWQDYMQTAESAWWEIGR